MTEMSITLHWKQSEFERASRSRTVLGGGCRGQYRLQSIDGFRVGRSVPKGRCRALSAPSATVACMTQQHHVDTAGLPPLAPPDANDDERARAIMARMVARHGAPSLFDAA